MNINNRTEQIKIKQIKTNQIKPLNSADMGAFQQTSANFVSEAASWPTNLSGYLQDGFLCCMLHVSIEIGVGDPYGCAGWKPGTHKSIQALYTGSGFRGRCFAQPGQLVLDRRVALQARDMTNPGCAALGDTGVIGRKYRSGLPIGVSAYGAGYCYLSAFSVGVRSRVARILGPLPYVADVLRLMRVLGDEYVQADWKKLDDGVYHVVALKDPNVVSGKFFRDGWRILSAGDTKARVGADLDTFPGMVIKGLSFLINCGRVDEERDQQPSEVSWLLEESNDEVDAGLDYSNVDGKGKVYCRDCRYHVNPVDHSFRCVKKVKIDDVDREYDTFAAAWMGDVVHRRDVRFFCLMRRDVPKEKKGELEESYVKRQAQAAFYVSYPGKKVPAHGISDKSLSTAFEASYCGQFRDDYIKAKFGKLRVKDLPKYLQPFAGAL